MELFYSDDINGSVCRLNQDESNHCVKVLRHREGDEITVIDGEGTMFVCRLTDASPKSAEAMILSSEKGWGSHPYHLTMAVCPTKNADRYEWFAEKATEMGLDRIVPVIGEHSERKVFKTERLQRILLSATKQSLKSAIPQVDEATGLKEFIRSYKDNQDCLKLIACCFEGEAPRRSIKDELASYQGREIAVLIGPEGDFSKEEVELAVDCGFIPVHIGASRLRTETAALTSVAAVYLNYLCI